MRLQTVAIEGYRSIKERFTLHLDGRITVLLGANDHGKTNILDALALLNRDASFKTLTNSCRAFSIRLT